MSLDAANLQELAKAIAAIGSPPAANAVSIKLPDFWTEDPELWFARAEAQFSTRDIKSDDTKFNYVVAALDNTTATEVKPILLKPPSNKYDALKSALIAAFSKSQEQKDAELLAISGLGDRKPTALLRKILSLNTDADTLRRAFFLAQLPMDVRAVLAAQDITDVEELAKAADRIVESKALAQQGYVSEVSRIRSRTAPKTQTPASPVTPSPAVCFFHSKFGSKARNCRPGCLFADLLDPTAEPAAPKAAAHKPWPGNGNAGR